MKIPNINRWYFSKNLDLLWIYTRINTGSCLHKCFVTANKPKCVFCVCVMHLCTYAESIYYMLRIHTHTLTDRITSIALVGIVEMMASQEHAIREFIKWHYWYRIEISEHIQKDNSQSIDQMRVHLLLSIPRFQSTAFECALPNIIVSFIESNSGPELCHSE